MKPWLCLVGLVAACSSSTTIETQRDAGADSGGGSGANPGGSAGNSGAGTSGQGGTLGSNGAAGSGGTAATSGNAGVGASAGASGTAGTNGNAGAAGAAGTNGNAGTAGSGGGGTADGSVGSGGACSPTNVTVDFTAQGNVRRDKFDQSGVAIVGSSELQFSDESSTTALDAGLGVFGGLYNWAIDNEEFVSVTFTPAPATNVKYFVDGALDVDHDGVFGKTRLSAISATGEALAPLTITDPGLKNVSALFGNVPLSKITIAAIGADGVVLGNLSFSECL